MAGPPPSDQQDTDFFVSYTSTDKDSAEWIAWQLKEAGYSLIFQAWHMPPGSDFAVEMQKGLQRCRRILAVASPAYFQSKHCMAEWNTGYRRDPDGTLQVLLPVWVKEGRAPDMHQGRVHISLIGLDETTARERLLAAIKPALPATPPTPGFPSQPLPAPYTPATPPPFPIAEAFATLKEDTTSILRFLHEALPQFQSRAASIPFLAPSRLPPAAGKLFGRDDEVARLLDLLTTHHRVAVTGPGGLGKTALCAEALRQLREDPATADRLQGGLYLHDFYQHPSLAAFVENIALQAGVAEEGDKVRPALVAIALRQPGTVLYIEGAEKLDDISGLLAFLDDRTLLLLTTRDPRQAEGMNVLALDPLDESAAAAAIHHYASTRPRSLQAAPYPFAASAPGWQFLARDLGGHPLGCRIAGEHCGLVGLDPAALHQQLKDEGLQPLIKGGNTKHNLHMLFRQSAEAVLKLSPAPVKPTLLRRLLRSIQAAMSRDASSPPPVSPALFAWQTLSLGGSNPVPFSLSQACGVHSTAPIEPLLNLDLAWTTNVAGPGKEDAQEAAFALRHVMLSEWARTGLAAFGLKHEMMVRRAMAWGRKYFAQCAEHPEVYCHPERYRVIVPIAENLLQETERLPGLPPRDRAVFYYLPAMMHKHHASHLAAEAFYRRAVQRMESDAGDRAPETATALNNLAQLLQATNRLAEAEPLMRRALDIDRAHFGGRHFQVAIRLNFLAALLKTANRLAEAELLMGQALDIDLAALGGRHPSVAIDCTNLALLLLLQGTERFAGAESLMRQALRIDTENFGESHPNVAVGLNNLAQLLLAAKRFDEAEPLMHQALRINMACFGDTHPSVATDLNNLAQLLQETKRFDEAEPLMRKALKIDMENVADSRTNVARSLSNLSQLLRATQRFDEAEPLMRKALEIDKASFGEAHPKVAVRLNHLAQLLLETRRFDEAGPLMRQALKIDTESFGESHPRVAQDRSNLAQLLMDTGRLDEAEALLH